MKLNRRYTVAVVLIFIVAAVLGVRIADPTITQNEVAVSLEDRPAVITANSVRKLRGTDRTIEIRATSIDAKGNRRPELLIRTSVSASEEQYKTVIRSTDPDDNAAPITYFGTEGQGWTISNYLDGGWNTALSARYPAFGYTFSPDAIEQANGHVVHENETTLVVRLTNSSKAIDDAVTRSLGSTRPNASGELTIAIDKDNRYPRWAVITYSVPSQNRTERYHYQFSEYGEATVERPEGIPRISFWEVLGDVYYG